MGQSNCIKGIPQLKWRDKDMPFAGALEAATAPTSNPLAFDEVLALTGFALGFRWWEGGPEAKAKWCRSSMDIGYFPSVLEAITRHTGIGLTPLWYEGDLDDQAHGKLFGQIMASIDAGNAVLCSPFGNLGVIIGYEERDRVLQVNHYLAAEPARMSLNKIPGPPILSFWNRQKRPSLQKVTLNTALTEAVSLTGCEPLPYSGGAYHFGASAWQKVQTSLSNLDSFAEEDQKTFLSTLDFALHRVFDCRKAALCFLSRYCQSVYCGGQEQRWDLDKTTALATCLLKELDHFTDYTFYVEDTSVIQKTVPELVEAVSAIDAEMMDLA